MEKKVYRIIGCEQTAEGLSREETEINGVGWILVLARGGGGARAQRARRGSKLFFFFASAALQLWSSLLCPSLIPI